MSADNLNNSFPHTTTPRHTVMSTYETIKNVHQRLKANAASIQSGIGGGAHVLLGLTLSRQPYPTITKTDFTLPENTRSSSNRTHRTHIPPNQYNSPTT